MEKYIVNNRVFVSARTLEFGKLRTTLAQHLRTAEVDVRIQGEFAQVNDETVDMVAYHIQKCAGMIHLVGYCDGISAAKEARAEFLSKFTQLPFLHNQPELLAELGDFSDLTYTQWEAFIAIHYNIPVLVYVLDSPFAEKKATKRDLQFRERHLKRLQMAREFHVTFADPAGLLGRLIGDIHRLLPNVGDRRPESALPLEWAQPIFGRDVEINQGLRDLQESRLVTVHAPPGVGKTRVVQRIAYEAWKQEGIHTYYFDVNYTSSAEAVEDQIRREFGFSYDPSCDAQVHLAQQLARLGPILIILDNFEQIGNLQQASNARMTAEKTVAVWLKHANELRLLVGSRRRLELDGLERCLHLSALPVPSYREVRTLDLASLEKFDSLRMFFAEATRSGIRRDQLSEAERRSAAHVVAMTGGFPAPIHLAASRLRNCTVVEIEETMADCFKLPEGEDEKKACEYLHNQISQIFDALSPVSARLSFLQLSQFRGGFDMRAAVAVLNPDETGKALTRSQVEVILRKLVEAELLKNYDLQIGGERVKRFGFYLPIEEWAESLWGGASVFAEERAWHEAQASNYFCSYFEKQAVADLHEDSAVALDFMRLERENGLQCHHRAVAARDVPTIVRITFALLHPLQAQGPVTVLWDLLEKTLAFEMEIPPVQRAALVLAKSRCLFATGEYPAMVEQSQRAIDLARRANDDTALARCLAWSEYATAMLKGGTKDPVEWNGIVHSLLEARDFPFYADAVKDMSYALDWRGQPVLAIAAIDEALRALGPQGFAESRAKLLNMRGIVRWHDGQAAAAIEDFRKARRLFIRRGQTLWRAGVSTNLGLVLVDLERFKGARRILEYATKWHLEAGNPGWNSVNNVAMARLLLRERNFAGAIEWCERITPSVEKARYRENIALLTSVHGIALAGAGRWEEADRMLRLAVERMSVGSSYMRRIFATCVVAAECAVQMGDTAFARDCLQKAREVAVLRRIGADYHQAHYRELYARMNSLSSQIELSSIAP